MANQPNKPDEYDPFTGNSVKAWMRRAETPSFRSVPVSSVPQPRRSETRRDTIKEDDGPSRRIGRAVAQGYTPTEERAEISVAGLEQKMSAIELRSGQEQKMSAIELGSDPLPWKTASLTQPGIYFCPGPISKTIDSTRLREILDAAVESFKFLSLKVTYSDSPIRAYCVSMEMVEFVFNIWQDRKDKKKLIVELQRTFGESCKFHYYAQKIFGHVFGSKTLTANDVVATSDGSKEHIRSLMRLIPNRDGDDNTVDALQLIGEALNSKFLNERLLGLQSLAYLVDPSSTIPETSKAASSATLSSTTPEISTSTASAGASGSTPETSTATASAGPSSTTPKVSKVAASAALLGGVSVEVPIPIQEQIYSLVIDGKWIDEIEGVNIMFEKKRHIHLALIVMANAVRQLDDEGVDSFLKRDGIEKCLKDRMTLANALKDPHEAYHAIRILSFVDKERPGSWKVARELVEKVVQVGERCHAVLAKEASLLASVALS